MVDFTGKVVIVTGAGSGIGAATAQRLARDGAAVVLAGRRVDRLEAASSGMAAQRTLVHATDVSDQAACEGLVAAAVARFGRLDVLVNNAGAAAFGPFLAAGLDDYRRIMATNVDGVVYCTRAALPHLLESRGNVVNVSSVSGIGGDWGLAFYNASKGALTNLTRALALEFGGSGVRVNAVNPSLTATDMAAGLTGNPEMMAKFMDRSPLGRAAEPADIADVIAFLASDDARFVTGVNLPVDGGISASNGQPRMM
jgi:meso-butanediol dehydrogenase/(S,S)-butanediol dehydrogenase/diacetyl reductase